MISFDDYKEDVETFDIRPEGFSFAVKFSQSQGQGSLFTRGQIPGVDAIKFPFPAQLNLCYAVGDVNQEKVIGGEHINIQITALNDVSNEINPGFDRMTTFTNNLLGTAHSNETTLEVNCRNYNNLLPFGLIYGRLNITWTLDFQLFINDLVTLRFYFRFKRV